jgi:CubicO group peptidase (beta-lactamase class C family)
MINHSRSHTLVTFFCLSLLLASCAVPRPDHGDGNLPVGPAITRMEIDVTLSDWLVLGPFEREISDSLLGDGTYDQSFSRDLLEPLGGETAAALSPDMKLHEMHVESIQANSLGIVDLAAHFNNLENHVAYGAAYVFSTTPQKVACLLGSDDAVKVWVNGKLVHENYVFRGVNPGEDRFEVALNAGLNTILVKVLNGVRGWGYSLQFLDQEKWSQLQNLESKNKRLLDFMNLEIVPDFYNSWDETFNPGPFPELRWSQPYLAKQILGDNELKIRWFDDEMNEVQTAEHPGRYGFVAETAMPDGKNIRRAGTLYCYPWDWMGWSERPYADLKPLPAARFDPTKWLQHRDAIGRDVGRIMLLSTLNQEEGAVLMAFLYEMNQGKYDDVPFISPLVANEEYHIKLQKKIGGVNYSGPGLARPTKQPGLGATVLHEGSPAEAGFKPEIIEDVQKVCDAWFEASGEPFITLIARNGIVVYHQAVGQDETEVFSRTTATPMASITKLITGVTFAQFMEQGLVQIDDPVGKIFPDFPLSGDKAITLRHCFTHTTGLVGHERWGGVHNHRLENVVANQLDMLPVGTRSTYNGDGYNLGGRVMEAIAQKSIFRIVHENLFTPLEMNTAVMEEDLAFSLNGTALDLAKVGQLLLNRGSYGSYKLFSPEVFEQILPKDLSQFYPGMNWEQGIGLTWMSQNHPDAGKNGLAPDQKLLSPRIIGHGSATSAILQVDLDHDIVITQSRRRGGAHYDAYLTKLLLAIEKNLE